MRTHRTVSRVALMVLSKKAAYKSEKGYYKVIKSSSWKTIKIKLILKSDKELWPTPSLYPDQLSWKVRWINPDSHNHFYRLRPQRTLQEKCEPEITSKHIPKQKFYSKRKTSSVLFCILVYKICLPLSCHHWMLCITLLWHDLKPYCSIHVTFHLFSS